MKKRMLSLLLAVALVLGLCPSVFAAGSSYADVLDTHWAHPYIEDVTEKGIMNGVDDKNFAPEDAMTRAMFVTVLARLSGDTLTEQTSFSDVPARSVVFRCRELGGGKRHRARLSGRHVCPRQGRFP